MLSVVCALALSPSSADSDLRVVFDKPANHFTESCPVGNGRLGAMDFGGVEHERIVLNENTMWSGRPFDQNRKDAWTHRAEILRLLFAGDNPAAEKLVGQFFTCDGPGSGSGSGKDGPYGCYQTLGDLTIDFLGTRTKPVSLSDPDPFQSDPPPAVTNYRRELDLENAVSRTSFDRGDVHYTREVIVSHPDQVIAVHLTASKKGALNLNIGLSREGVPAKRGPDGIQVLGSLSDHLSYKSRLLVATGDGGMFWPYTRGRDLMLTGATDVVLLIGAGTNYKGPVKGRFMGDGYMQTVDRQLEAADAKGWKRLLADHVKDYRKLFDRVRLELPSGDLRGIDSTAQRMAAIQRGGYDPAFAALYFQYGRYLMISSSREGGLPANLQGLWAEETQTPWNGDYHIDINVQMNYWPVEAGNLAECQLPLTSLVESLVEPGSRTAKAYYDAPGWVAHVITNPWGFTEPGESASWGSTNSGGGWLCEHLFDHWAFTQDKAYLKRVYPVLKKASEFYAAMLVEEPKHHWLVTGPSNSPENAFRLPDGRTATTCLGPTIDMQILRELFGNTAVAARELGVDPSFAQSLLATRARLAPHQIGPDGRLQEWLEPYDEPEPTHRHTSHLYGLHPSDQISRFGTPELAAAARKTLEMRGDASTGWSMAWKVCFWARLGDGDRALKLLTDVGSPGTELEFAL